MSELSEQTYFSHTELMSYSQFSHFLNCEAEALAEIEGRWEEPKSDSMLVGSYVDEFFNGKLDDFKAKHPEILKRDGTLKSDFVKAEQVIESINGDDFFKSFYGGAKQIIEVGTIAGVQFKVKMDSVFDDKIADQKVMKDCNDIWTKDGKVPFWKAYHYDIQAAIYQEIHAQNIGKKLPFYLAVSTKENIPDKRIFLFNQKTLDEALAMVRDLAPRFDAIKRHKVEPIGCGECDYCRSVKKLTERDIENA